MPKNAHPCNDCKKFTAQFPDEGGMILPSKDYYSINVDVWLQVATNEEILCIDCLEKRLKRKVTVFDFNYAIPININNTRVMELITSEAALYIINAYRKIDDMFGSAYTFERDKIRKHIRNLIWDLHKH